MKFLSHPFTWIFLAGIAIGLLTSFFFPHLLNLINLSRLGWWIISTATLIGAGYNLASIFQ